MGEIFALGRESFFGGQRSFQVQAYPFRMTPNNLARHRNNPHFAFWKNLKEGNDHFEVTRTEPKVDVCGKRYVFNASASSPFQPAGPCPAFEVPDEIETPVAAKRQRDEARFAEALARVTPAPVKVGNDGGMHPVFVSTLSPQQVQDDKGNVRWIVEAPKGAVPRINDAPQMELASAATGSLSEAPAPAAAPASRTASTASAPRSGASAYNASPKAEPDSSSKIGQMFSNLFSFGSKSDEAETAADAASAKASGGVPMPRPAPRTAERSPTVAAAPAASTPPAAAPSPRSAETARNEPQPASRPAAAASLMTGAQPLVQSGTFDSRWSSFR
jgi:hypothetical protein